MEIALGQTIGPYRLIRKLGEGTTSRVFEVEHVRIRRRAAMKIAHSDATLPGIGSRLFAEAQAVNLINHPNIVAITEIIEPTAQHPAFALVMELLDGRLLADVIADQGRLAPARFLPILAQVCDGLAAVHAAGFVHRDLKPENICLVERQGRRDVVKLLDFGLVKAMRADVAPLTATREGTFMGSPAYTSPEQAQGNPVDQRTDIYAAGIMIYELVTGRLPFEADGIGDLLMKQITVPPPRLPTAELGTDVGRALDAIIQTCLAKNPAERTLTAAELAETFRRLAAGERLAPARIRAAGGQGAAVRRRRRLLALAPVAALAAAAAALIATGAATRIGAAREPAGARAAAVAKVSAAPATRAAPGAGAKARAGSGAPTAQAAGADIAAAVDTDVAASAATAAHETPAPPRPAPGSRRWARSARGRISKARTLDPYR